MEGDPANEPSEEINYNQEEYKKLEQEIKQKSAGSDYSELVQQLKELGFSDPDVNSQALQLTNGDLDDAIKLIQQLESLQEAGFTDKNKNLLALRATSNEFLDASELLMQIQ